MLDVALEAGALDRVGAAVHPLQDAALDELAQVAPDGLLGTARSAGEAADLDPAVGAGPDQDLALTLVRLHRRLLPLPPSRVTCATSSVCMRDRAATSPNGHARVSGSCGPKWPVSPVTAPSGVALTGQPVRATMTECGSLLCPFGHLSGAGAGMPTDVPVARCPSSGRRVSQAWESVRTVVTRPRRAGRWRPARTRARARAAPLARPAGRHDPAEQPRLPHHRVVPAEDLWRSCHDNLTRILQLVGSAEARFDQEYYDAARATGRRRAEQGLPLDDLLRSFRIGGRLVWEALVAEARSLGVDDDGMLDVGTRVWEVVDRSSAQVAAAYHDAERTAVRADEQRRTSIWEGLLSGVGEDPGFAFEAARMLEVPGRRPLPRGGRRARVPGHRHRPAAARPARRASACGRPGRRAARR